MWAGSRPPSHHSSQPASSRAAVTCHTSMASSAGHDCHPSVAGNAAAVWREPQPNRCRPWRHRPTCVHGGTKRQGSTGCATGSLLHSTSCATLPRLCHSTMVPWCALRRRGKVTTGRRPPPGCCLRCWTGHPGPERCAVYFTLSAWTGRGSQPRIPMPHCRTAPAIRSAPCPSPPRACMARPRRLVHTL